MTGICDASLLFLGNDLIIEFVSHALELGDHQVELQELLPLLVDLKLLEPNQVLTWFHHLLLPNAYSAPKTPAHSYKKPLCRDYSHRMQTNS